MKLVKRVTSVVAGLVILTLLAACGTAPVPVPVVTYHSVVITPPKSLIPHCATTTPPNRNAFATLTAIQRLDAMSDNDSAQMLNIKTCNDGLDALQTWIDKNLAVYQLDSTTTFVGQAPASLSTPLGSAAAFK